MSIELLDEKLTDLVITKCGSIKSNKIEDSMSLILILITEKQS